MTILRAESLVNDGTALVIYGGAVAAAARTEQVTALSVSGHVLLSYVGGIGAGVVIAWIARRLRSRIDDTLQENVLSFLTRFVAFLLAESVHASGVLLTVVAGLLMARSAPRIGSAPARLQAIGFWELSTHVLNGSLFVLIGLEANAAARALDPATVDRAVLMVLLVAAVLVATRIAFLFVAVHTIRVLDRRPEQKLRRASHRARVVSVVSGFRGAVSLAAALAIPATTETGAAFPERDMIIFVTAGVIMVSLLPAVVLPQVLRWANLPREDATAARQFAMQRVGDAALDALRMMAEEEGVDDLVVRRLFEEQSAHLDARSNVIASGDEKDLEPQYRTLKLRMIEVKRDAAVRLRDAGQIDDSVLLDMQMRLDIEEIRLMTAES